MPTTTDLTSLMARPSGPWWAHADHDRPDLVAMPGVGSVVVAKVTVGGHHEPRCEWPAALRFAALG